MVNINKLKGKIIENELTITELANEIGVSKDSLYRKLNNNGETLTISEANRIAKRLHLTLEEVNSIFFSQFVAQYANSKEVYKNVYRI